MRPAISFRGEVGTEAGYLWRAVARWWRQALAPMTLFEGYPRMRARLLIGSAVVVATMIVSVAAVPARNGRSSPEAALPSGRTSRSARLPLTTAPTDIDQAAASTAPPSSTTTTTVPASRTVLIVGDS